MFVRIFIGILVIMLAVASAVAMENKGPAKISLDGGTRGVVPFPHARHQVALGDCQVCHTLFPQEIGGIRRLKAKGVLVKQEVMKKHCIKCHRAMKKMGNPTGPLTCSRCHVKPLKE